MKSYLKDHKTGVKVIFCPLLNKRIENRTLFSVITTDVPFQDYILQNNNPARASHYVLSTAWKYLISCFVDEDTKPLSFPPRNFDKLFNNSIPAKLPPFDEWNEME